MYRYSELVQICGTPKPIKPHMLFFPNLKFFGTLKSVFLILLSSVSQHPLPQDRPRSRRPRALCGSAALSPVVAAGTLRGEGREASPSLSPARLPAPGRSPSAGTAPTVRWVSHRKSSTAQPLPSPWRGPVPHLHGRPRDSGCDGSYRQRARPPLPRAAMAGRLRRRAAVSLAQANRRPTPRARDDGPTPSA